MPTANFSSASSARRRPSALVWLLTLPFQVILFWARGLAQSWREAFSDDPEETPLVDAVSTAVQSPSTLLEHLDALRKHLLRGLLMLALTTILSFNFVYQIMQFMAAPLPGGLDALRGIDVTENIATVMRVAVLAGFALSFPYIVLEIWLFIAPGLKRNERLFGLVAIPFATLSFLGGMAFANFLMMPAALPFLLNFMGLKSELTTARYFDFITNLLFWIGLFFEFPLVIFVLAKVGLVKARMLADQWRVAVVIMAIIAAMVTPTVDPGNMALVMAPMIVLYALSIGLAFLAQGKRREEGEAVDQ